MDALGDIEVCHEVKLVDFAEAGYYSTNKPNPQGEIWIRGEIIARGYYDDPVQTAEYFTGKSPLPFL
jgi:long-chain acyl-CoA synthetase